MLSLRSRDVGHVRWVPDDSALESVFNQVRVLPNGCSNPCPTTSSRCLLLNLVIVDLCVDQLQASGIGVIRFWDVQIMASNNHMLIATRGASRVTTALSARMSGDGSNGGEAVPAETVCYDADPTEVVGLITLEDIIEEVPSSTFRIPHSAFLHCMGLPVRNTPLPAIGGQFWRKSLMCTVEEVQACFSARAFTSDGSETAWGFEASGVFAI